MKLVERGAGKTERTIATPKVTVLEGQPAQLTCGHNHARLWKQGMPANDMGHDGYHVSLLCTPDKNNKVRVACWLWVSEPVGDNSTSEGRVHTTRLVELGKKTTLHCCRPCGSDSVECCLEATIQECAETPSPDNAVRACPSAAYGCTEPCEGLPGCAVTFAARIPVKVAEASPKFTVKLTAPVVHCKGFHGKLADLQACAKQSLEVTCGDSTLVCDSFELKTPGFETVKLCVKDGKVCICGDSLNARADELTSDQKGTLTLSGKVKLNSSKNNGREFETEKVKIKLEEAILQTGVIASPSLVQE